MLPISNSFVEIKMMMITRSWWYDDDDDDDDDDKRWWWLHDDDDDDYDDDDGEFPIMANNISTNWNQHEIQLLCKVCENNDGSCDSILTLMACLWFLSQHPPGTNMYEDIQST